MLNIEEKKHKMKREVVTGKSNFLRIMRANGRMRKREWK